MNRSRGANKAFQARSALEALRSGVVSSSAVELATCGRDADLASMYDHIRSSPAGSTQVIFGGYGVGKTHLCESFARRVLDQGYAVARLELGSSSERAEHPDSVVSAIERSIEVRIGTHLFRGHEDLFVLRRAIKVRQNDGHGVQDLVRHVHRRFADAGVADRAAEIREAIVQRFGSVGQVAPSGLLHCGLPAAMTAASRAVARVTDLAVELRGHADARGLVLIFDEAERSEWAATPHRLEQARNLIVWFALRSANLDTSGLKTYRDEGLKSWHVSSFMHTVFAFTRGYGLSWYIGGKTGCPVRRLEPLEPQHRLEVLQRILEVYKTAYNGRSCALTERDVRRIVTENDAEDIRLFTRTIVGALDDLRWNS